MTVSGQNRILDGKIFVSGNSPFDVDSKYVLFEKRDNRKKTGFQDPGHKNWYKPCQEDVELHGKEILMIITNACNVKEFLADE